MPRMFTFTREGDMVMMTAVRHIVPCKCGMGCPVTVIGETLVFDVDTGETLDKMDEAFPFDDGIMVLGLDG